MVILHVAAIKNVYTSGVDVAVPQHINAQAEKEQVALLNINNVPIDAVKQQIIYQKNFSIEQLPKPFCKPDLVVFHNTYYPAFLKISKNLKKHNIEYVIIPHGALSKTAQRKKWLKKAVANILLFNVFFDGAKAIQFLSDREMQSSKYRSKGFVGSNGVSIPQQMLRPAYRNEIKMVYIGRTEVHIKGLDMMLDAVDRNRRLFENYNIHLDLYGPDWQDGHSQIRNLIKKYNVADFVALHDAVVREEKERILLNADIFIQTSRTEGMPMGILEALSYGIPCIVTEGTGLGDIINQYNAGWVAETNSESIANAMKSAVTDRGSWSEKSKQARTLAVENYAWKKTAEDAITVYKKLV